MAHDGTTAFTVTVTNASGAVPDAYVNVEFWDNEATTIKDGNTTLLKLVTITTAANGKAIFNVEVPDVAGAIYFIAGTDQGGSSDSPDYYFDHFGLKTVPVSEKEAVAITVTPTTYTQGIPYDLNVTLANSPSTLHVLDKVDSDGWINITISGDEINATEVGSSSKHDTLELKNADTNLNVTKVYVDGKDNTSKLCDGNLDAFVTGDVWVIQCRADAGSKPFQIQLYNFSVAKVGSVVVSAKVDIGGFDGGLATLTEDNAADGLADYVDTGHKTITIEVPEAVTFVGLTPDEIPACTNTEVKFTAYYYNETEKATQLATSFDVTLEYPTGRTYEGTTDASTGVFSTTLQLGTEPYWADEAGTMTITVSGKKGTVTYSGVATIPVTGYLISTDVDTIVVKTNNTITITVLSATGTVKNNANVSMTTDSGTLTSSNMTGDLVVIDGTVADIEGGQYIFHDVNASQVSTITVFANTSSNVPMARLTIEASNPVLDITSTKDILTNIVDNEFTIRVMHETTPEAGATIEMNVTFTAIPTEKTTNTTGYSKITIEYDELPTTVTAVKIYVVSSDVSRTGELVLPVAIPVYEPNATYYLTAGLDSYGNFTIKSADEEEIILVDPSANDTSSVLAAANIFLNDTSGGKLADKALAVTNGYAWFKLAAENSTTALYVKKNALNITAVTATPTPLTALVESIPIYNPIVSNTTYTGFPITYTAYVGQSTNFYIKIQDASGAPVEGAIISIEGTEVSGTTDAAGETTITWTPLSTGTCKLRLNEVLDIGTITVESYEAPLLVIDYSPKPVYLNDIVTITVTAEETPIMGASVTIIDPDGVSISRTTTAAGTCTFTANKLGYWSVSASKTDYTDATPVSIEVLERIPVTEYSITLSEGWNLISLPLIPENSSVEAVLADIVADVDKVWSYNTVTNDWLNYKPGVPSDLTEMVDGKGYLIKMNASAVLTVYGTEMPEDPTAPLPAYPVVVGWNLIGYKETYSMTVSEYLEGISYARVYEYRDGYRSLSADDLMVPGRGYWIAVTESGTIYP